MCQLDGSGKPDVVSGSSIIGIPALVTAGVVSPDGKTLARIIQVLNPDTQEYQYKIALLNLESFDCSTYARRQRTFGSEGLIFRGQV